MNSGISPYTVFYLPRKLKSYTCYVRAAAATESEFVSGSGFDKQIHDQLDLKRLHVLVYSMTSFETGGHCVINIEAFILK